jgi:hypothetical protein
MKNTRYILVVCFVMAAMFAGPSKVTAVVDNAPAGRVITEKDASVLPQKTVDHPVSEHSSSVSKRKPSAYRAWKTEHVPFYSEKNSPQGFWTRKTIQLTETLFAISIAVLLASALEVSGFVKFFSIFFWPLIRLGRLTPATAPAFFAALRKASIANGILVAARDTGRINNRQLYTSVLVSSSLSTLGHLPSYILAIGMVCGSQAMTVVTGVRLGAIFAQIIVVLILSAWIIAPAMGVENIVRPDAPDNASEKTAVKTSQRTRLFLEQVWQRSIKTIKRIGLFFILTFTLVSLMEFCGVFDYLGNALPWLFNPSFLPPQSSVIIPAQAAGIFSGTAAAAGFIQDGTLSAKQVLTILLAGSGVTAPVRTLKRILPTYIGMLGFRPGVIMAFTAQLLRMMFLAAATWIMWVVW